MGPVPRGERASDIFSQTPDSLEFSSERSATNRLSSFHVLHFPNIEAFTYSKMVFLQHVKDEKPAFPQAVGAERPRDVLSVLLQEAPPHSASQKYCGGPPRRLS